MRVPRVSDERSTSLSVGVRRGRERGGRERKRRERETGDNPFFTFLSFQSATLPATFAVIKFKRALDGRARASAAAFCFSRY